MFDWVGRRIGDLVGVLGERFVGGLVGTFLSTCLLKQCMCTCMQGCDGAQVLEGVQIWLQESE